MKWYVAKRGGKILLPYAREREALVWDEIIRRCQELMGLPLQKTHAKAALRLGGWDVVRVEVAEL
jgi:hypothetical protein